MPSYTVLDVDQLKKLYDKLRASENTPSDTLPQEVIDHYRHLIK